MDKIIGILAGRKTYIIAILAGLSSFAFAMGWISQEQLIRIDAILAPLGLAFLRAGVSKS